MAITIDDIYLRDGGVCGICGDPVKLKQASVDHIVPRSKGGKDCLHNTQTTHWDCNRRKRARMPDAVPEPCDCPESEYCPAPAAPIEKRDSPKVEADPSLRLQHEGKPDDLRLSVSVTNQFGEPKGYFRLTFADQKTWSFAISIPELDALLSSIHTAHAIVRAHDYDRWTREEKEKHGSDA